MIKSIYHKKQWRQVAGFRVREDEEEEGKIFPTPEEAMDVYLHGMEPDYIPDIVTLDMYIRKMPAVEEMGNPLLDVLEKLDATCGDPSGYHEQPEEAMKPMRKAERKFLNAIREWYAAWAYERVGARSANINVRQWLKKNRPDWFIEFQGREEEVLDRS